MKSSQTARRSKPSKRTPQEDRKLQDLIPIKRYARCDSPEFSFFSKSQLEARERLGLDKKNIDQFWPSPSPSISSSSTSESPPPSPPPRPIKVKKTNKSQNQQQVICISSSPSPPPAARKIPDQHQSSPAATSATPTMLTPLPSAQTPPSLTPSPPPPVAGSLPKSIEPYPIEKTQQKTKDVSKLTQVEDNIQREIDRLLDIQEKFVMEIRYAFENLRKVKDIISSLGKK